MSFRVQRLTVTFIAACVIFVATQSAMAVSFGGKIGLSFAKQDFKYASSTYNFDTDTRTGITAGIFVEQPVIPFLSFRAEALYIQKGFKEDVTFFTEEVVPYTKMSYYRIDYLSLNALGKVSLPIHTYLVAGPRLDLN